MREKKENVPMLRFPEFSGEWVEQKIKKIGNVITGTTPSTFVDDYYNGDYMFVSPYDISNSRYVTATKTTITELGMEKCRPIPKGSVMFVCIGSTIGKIAQASLECATNQQINAVVPFSEFNSDFIYSLLENNASVIKLLAGTQAVPMLNKSDFSNIRLKSPLLPEQTKIADFLTVIDERIDLLNQKKKMLETYKKGVMQKLFSQELRFKDENGNDYPEWEEKTFGDILKQTLRKTPKPDKPYMTLGVRSHAKGTMHKFIEEPEKIVMKELFIVRENDLIVSITFAWEHAIAVCKESDDGRLVSHRFPTYTARENLNIQFLENVIKSKRIKSELELISPGGAGRNRVMNQGKFLKIKTMIPSLNEQEKIANFLSSIDDKITTMNNKITNSKEYKKGLLQQMFV